jgi:hypothetical protein
MLSQNENEMWTAATGPSFSWNHNIRERKKKEGAWCAARSSSSGPNGAGALFPRFLLFRRPSPIESVCRLAVRAWDPGSLTSHHAFSRARGTATANYSDTATALLVQYVLGQLGSPLALLEWSGMVVLLLGSSTLAPPICDPTGWACGGWQFACRSTLAVQSSVSSGVG